MFNIFESWFQGTTIPAPVLESLRDGIYPYQKRERDYKHPISILGSERGADYYRRECLSRSHLERHCIKGNALVFRNLTERDICALNSVISKNSIIELHLHGALTATSFRTLMQSLQGTPYSSLQTHTVSSSQQYSLRAERTFLEIGEEPSDDDIEAKAIYAKAVFDFMSILLLQFELRHECDPSKEDKIRIIPPGDLSLVYGMGALLALGVDYSAIAIDMTNVCKYRTHVPNPYYFSNYIFSSQEHTPSKIRNRKIDVHNSEFVQMFMEALIGRKSTSQPIPKHLLSERAAHGKFGYRTQYDIKMIADRIADIETIRSSKVVTSISHPQLKKNKMEIIYGDCLTITIEDLPIIANRLRNRWLPLRLFLHDSALTDESLEIITQGIPNSVIDELHIMENNKRVVNNPKINRIDELVVQNQRVLDVELALIKKIPIPSSMATVSSSTFSSGMIVPSIAHNTQITAHSLKQSASVVHQQPMMSGTFSSQPQLSSKSTGTSYRFGDMSEDDLFELVRNGQSSLNSDTASLGVEQKIGQPNIQTPAHLEQHLKQAQEDYNALMARLENEDLFAPLSLPSSRPLSDKTLQPEMKLLIETLGDYSVEELRSVGLCPTLFSQFKQEEVTPVVVQRGGFKKPSDLERFRKRYNATGVCVSNKHPSTSNASTSNTNTSQHIEGTNTLSSIKGTSVEVLSETEDFSISREDFEALAKQLEKSEKRYVISVEMLDEKIKACKQQLMPSSFSSEDETWQAHLAKYRKKEALLVERQTILSNPTLEAYYRAIQTHFSCLMVASLGIGSGYVSITNGQAATVVGWICNAISSAFPGASIVTTAVSAGVNYLDTRYRDAFLAKIRVFGSTVTEAEILGEQVARLLVRVHAHKKTALSKTQADKDAEALINAILQASEPIARNKSTAHELLQMMFGDIPYCTDLLPIAAAVAIEPDSYTVPLTLTQSYMGQSISASRLTSIGYETEFSHLQDKLDDIEEKTKDAPSQATVAELIQQIQTMQKTLSRLQASDRFVDPVEVVSFSNGAQAQTQLRVKRHNSAHSEHYQDQFDRKDQHIILLEEQMQVMVQQLVMLQEHLLSVVQYSHMAEDEKQVIEDDVNSFKRVSVPTQRRAPQQQLEDRRLKCSLFGQSAPLISDVQSQDIQTEVNKKKTEKIALDLKNTIQACIKSSLLEATAEYICFCDAQKGIVSHGGSSSRMDCRALNLLAEQELFTQLVHLIQRFDSHTSSSKMGNYSLDTFIVNVLIRKSSQAPLLQTKMRTTNLSASDKNAIKIPRPLFGIYSDSYVAENCLRREQIRRALISIQQEFIADCRVTGTVRLFS